MGVLNEKRCKNANSSINYNCNYKITIVLQLQFVKSQKSLFYKNYKIHNCNLQKYKCENEICKIHRDNSLYICKNGEHGKTNTIIYTNQ